MTTPLSWDADSLVDRYGEVRAHTETLAAPLSPEDQTVQSMISGSQFAILNTPRL